LSGTRRILDKQARIALKKAVKMTIKPIIRRQSTLVGGLMRSTRDLLKPYLSMGRIGTKFTSMLDRGLVPKQDPMLRSISTS
jgi:hypothetical protein